MPAKKEIDRTALINYTKNGATKKHIAKSLNVSRVTLWNYLKNNPITSHELASGYEIKQAVNKPKLKKEKPQPSPRAEESNITTKESDAAAESLMEIMRRMSEKEE